MKHISIVLLIACACVMTSCSSNTPTKTIKQMAAVGQNEEKAKSYYTKRTVELLDEIETLMPEEAGEHPSYNVLAEDADWEVVEEKIDGDRATVTIKITSDSNPSGLHQTMRMKKEDGEWKIDCENELEASVKMLKNASNAMKGVGDAMKAFGNMLNSATQK
jgi:hypothetical protein